jgi:predicted ester cyclase
VNAFKKNYKINNSKEIYNAYETCLLQKYISTRTMAFQCEYTISHVGTDQVRDNYCDVMCHVVPALPDLIKLDYV